MIVQYEEGDFARVEDSHRAGDLSASEVTLIRKEGNAWYCENMTPEFGGPNHGYVKEEWLSPSC